MHLWSTLLHDWEYYYELIASPFIVQLHPFAYIIHLSPLLFIMHCWHLLLSTLYDLLYSALISIDVPSIADTRWKASVPGGRKLINRQTQKDPRSQRPQVQTPSPSNTVFYRCLNEVPSNALKKIKHPSNTSKGIIRADWLSKVTERVNLPSCSIPKWLCSSSTAATRIKVFVALRRHLAPGVKAKIDPQANQPLCRRRSQGQPQGRRALKNSANSEQGTAEHELTPLKSGLLSQNIRQGHFRSAVGLTDERNSQVPFPSDRHRGQWLAAL